MQSSGKAKDFDVYGRGSSTVPRQHPETFGDKASRSISDLDVAKRKEKGGKNDTGAEK
jgi:hypothetical protein